MTNEDLREMSNENFERLLDKPSTPESHPERYDSIAPVVFEYIHKITRRICPRLDHEEIAMDLWTKCWQEKRMPTYTQVRNHCLDALRKNRTEIKRYGQLNFMGEKVAAELPNDIFEELVKRAKLNGAEQTAIFTRFYENRSATNVHFYNAIEKLQRAWKEYCNERDEQE